MNNEIDTIVHQDEDGIETEFEVITKLDIEDEEYFIVTPIDDEEGDAIALKVVIDSDGNESLMTVEDEEEFELVSEAYSTIFSDNTLN